MQSIIQISKEYNIPKTTLISRIRKNNLTVLKKQGFYLINEEQEKVLINHVQNQYRGYVNRNLNEALIWQFKNENPELSNIEISQSLSVELVDIELILGKDYLILESRINKIVSKKWINNVQELKAN